MVSAVAPPSLHLEAQSPPRQGLHSKAPLPHHGPTVDESGSHRDENSLRVFRTGSIFTVILGSDLMCTLAEDDGALAE